MYNSYFGFREKPFKLVPNPEYLFLSKTHEIALAHLTYAADQGDGFVVIIGEVGTGKTTLCRNYLESLDDQISSAYIFNPQLNPTELLAGICHEYGISTDRESTKALLDALNEFLIQQNLDGRKVVLLIDEAQLLSIESLELVRMLSNLETTKNKLLQIILVGQPELGDKLETYELRQLAQRISLNYHLTPLSAQDTGAYIQHRLGIALQRQSTLFTPNACRLAYHYSKGIPRLINIVADRALLIAYTRNKPKVTKRLMQAAIKELTSSSGAPAGRKRRPLVIGACVCALIFILFGALYLLQFDKSNLLLRMGIHSGEPPLQAPDALPGQRFKVPFGHQDQRAVDQERAVSGEPESTAAAGDEESNNSGPAGGSKKSLSTDANAASVLAPPKSGNREADFKQWISALEPVLSRKMAAKQLLTIWDQPRANVDIIPAAVDDYHFFDIAARQYGLRRYSVRGNWELVRLIDLPAVLAFKSHPEADSVFLSMVGLKDGRLHLSDGENGSIHIVDFNIVKPYLDGPVHIFWKNITGFDMIIGYGADQRAVLMIKNLLRKIGYHQISLSPDFDDETRRAVKRFQSDHKLKNDGLVGPVTKIMLLREAGLLNAPQLDAGSGTGS